MVSVAKVAEYQMRSAIHFHGVVRLDGAAGPGDPSPDLATTELLTDAVHTAAASANVRVSESDAYGTELLLFGEQLSVRPIWSFADDEGPTDDAVAAYVAKYVSKGTAETGAGLDYRVTSLDDIHTAMVTPHVRALMATCWRLGGLAELEHLRLRTWARTLGYRATSSQNPAATPPRTRPCVRSGPSTGAVIRGRPTGLPSSRTPTGATSAPATPPALPWPLPESLKITS